MKDEEGLNAKGVDATQYLFCPQGKGFAVQRGTTALLLSTLSLSLAGVAATKPLPRQIRNRNQKFDKNITKRGNVSLGKVEEKDDFPVSKGLIAFFLFLIVGSSVVQVLNLFRRGPALEE